MESWHAGCEAGLERAGAAEDLRAPGPGLRLEQSAGRPTSRAARRRHARRPRPCPTGQRPRAARAPTPAPPLRALRPRRRQGAAGRGRAHRGGRALARGTRCTCCSNTCRLPIRLGERARRLHPRAPDPCPHRAALLAEARASSTRPTSPLSSARRAGRGDRHRGPGRSLAAAARQDRPADRRRRPRARRRLQDERRRARQPEEVPEGILRQMGAYAAALAQIWPGRRVETAILWTRDADADAAARDLVAAALARALAEVTSGDA
jgi:ATP-dependent helicase/nuclease subunit A